MDEGLVKPGLLAFNVRRPSEMMANTIQTTLNCVCLAQHYAVELLLMGDQRIEQKFFDGLSDGAKKLSVRFFKSKIRMYLYIVFTLIVKDVTFYTRSALLGLCASALGRKSLLELHQDHLSRIYIIDRLLMILISKLQPSNLKLAVISESLRRILRRRGLLSDMAVLHDGFDKQSEIPNLRVSKPIVVYTGMVSEDRGFLEICDLASKNLTVKFVVMGANSGDVLELRRIAQSRGATNLKVFIKQDRRRVALFQANASVLIAVWGHNVPTMKYCSPLKIFEYMSTGRPILCHRFEVLSEVISFEQLGMRFFEPGDLCAAESGLDALLNDPNEQMGAMALKLAVDEYSYEKRAQKIFDLCA